MKNKEKLQNSPWALNGPKVMSFRGVGVNPKFLVPVPLKHFLASAATAPI